MLHEILNLVPSGITQGLILSLVALAMMIPFKLLQCADLTSEGSFPLGGAVTAALLMTGINPMLACVVAILAGGCLGAGTGFIVTRLKVNSLLAGIIISTVAYSINLRLMGKPNLALFDMATLYTFNPTYLLVAVNILIFSGLGYYLLTQSGLRFRAVGANPIFAQRHGLNTKTYIITGLFVANAFSGLAGSLFVQLQHYADIGMGVGIAIHGLAALMIGECLVGTNTLKQQVLAPLVGALIYQQIQGIVLMLGLAPSDLKLMTGVIVLITLALKQSGTLQRSKHAITGVAESRANVAPTVKMPV